MVEHILADTWLAILGAGQEQVPMYEVARNMGLKTVGFDSRADAPAVELADTFFPVSSSNAGDVLTALQASRIRPSGVITIGSDVSVAVATVQSHFGLPGQSIDIAKRFTDKLEMKSSFVKHHVPTPKHLVLHDDDVSPVLKAFEAAVVVKPADGRGARGVQLVNLSEKSKLEDAIRVARGMSSRREVIVEDYVSGPQYSTEGIFLDGRYLNVITSERNYARLGQFGTHIIEDGGQIPNHDDPAFHDEVSDLVARGALALGGHAGTVKGDLVRGPDGTLQIIELAGRLSGGWLASDQIPASRGVPFLQLAIKSAIGLPFTPSECLPTRSIALAVRYWFPTPGRITGVHGLEEVKSREGLVRVGLFRNKGDYQPVVTSHADRFGYVIFVGDTEMQAVGRATSAIGAVKIDISSEAATGLNVEPFIDS
jgi:biotin carboxylase